MSAAKPHVDLVCLDEVLLREMGKSSFFRESVHCFQPEKRPNIAEQESMGVGGGGTKTLLTISDSRRSPVT